MHIFKIRYKDTQYCLKSVHRSSNNCFIQEVSTLKKCSHPNVIGLVGVTVNADGKVDGMLTAWIENARPISEIEIISVEEAAKWIAQIKNAVDYLHKNGLVWGDAKASNVLIREDGSLVLIDFGGGHTKGWVESDNYETIRGDWQGFERISAFLQERVE